MCLEVFTKQSFASSTIKAVSAKFGVVRTYSIPDFEAFDIFTDGSNFPYSFVSRD